VKTNCISDKFETSALVSDISQLRQTIRSVSLADKLNSKNFKPLGKSKKSKESIRSKFDQKTPTQMFYYPVLEYLASNNRVANIKDIYLHLEMNMPFTPYDLTMTSGTKNEKKWRVTLRWAKEELIQKGLLKRVTGRGEWELTSSGYRWFLKNVD